ncbi:MAG: hypothetical protein AAB312_01415 [Pseudomonadota bacterium]
MERIQQHADRSQTPMALPQALLTKDTAPEQHKTQEVARMKRQRNAGKTVSSAIYPRIPLRSIRACMLLLARNMFTDIEAWF